MIIYCILSKRSYEEGIGNFKVEYSADNKNGVENLQGITQLDEIIQTMIKAVEKGSRQISNICSKSRSEFDDLLSVLIDYKAEILEAVTEADRIEKEEKLARINLTEISRNMQTYEKKDIQDAHKDVQSLQTRLGKIRQRETELQQKRAHLEVELRRLNETVERSDKMASQVNMCLSLLSGSLQGVTYKLEELQLRQQLSMRIIKAQEEERLRVAREIHDGPAQLMANVVLRAEICEKLMDIEPDKVRKELRDLKEMVKESLHEVRKIIFDLRPMVLDDLGVVPTLRRFIAELQKRSPISVELVVLSGEEYRLPGPLEVAVFRIVQEALNNIFKHAGAKRAVVRLELQPRRINVSISDDGCGFETQRIMGMGEMDRDNFGLLGMKERVELLSGQIKINSKPGKGTEIQVTIPVKE